MVMHEDCLVQVPEKLPEQLPEQEEPGRKIMTLKLTLFLFSIIKSGTEGILRIF